MARPFCLHAVVLLSLAAARAANDTTTDATHTTAGTYEASALRGRVGSGRRLCGGDGSSCCRGAKCVHRRELWVPSWAKKSIGIGTCSKSPVNGGCARDADCTTGWCDGGMLNQCASHCPPPPPRRPSECGELRGDDSPGAPSAVCGACCLVQSSTTVLLAVRWLMHPSASPHPLIPDVAGIGTCSRLPACCASLIPSVPPNMERADTSYDWCDCGTGLSTVTVWPYGDKSQAVTVSADDRNTATVSFGAPTAKIEWLCDGMRGNAQTTELDEASKTWSVRLTVDKKVSGVPRRPTPLAP